MISGPTFKVNQKEDTFELDYLERVPSIVKLDTDDHREWLHWCLRNGRNLGQKSSLRSYIDSSLEILSKLETAMHILRTDDGIVAE